MIKFLIIFTTCLLSSATSDEQPTSSETNTRDPLKEKVMKSIEKCAEILHSTDDEVENVITNGRARFFESNPLIKCLVKDLNLLDDNDKFVRSEVLDFVTEFANGHQQKIEATMHVFDACHEKEEAEYIECVKKEYKEMKRKKKSNKKPEIRGFMVEE